MSEKQDRVLRALETAGISYTLTEHPAVHTIEEMDVLPLPYPEAVLKNLFLQDAGGERFFLVSLPKDRRADWKALRTYAGSRLSFAGEEQLAALLGLERGSVTPFGALNDTESRVEVLWDMDIREMPLVGVHPCENTATVFLPPGDLARLLNACGHPVRWVVPS